MKLRTQLIAGITIFAIVLVIISAFVFVTNREMDRLTAQEDLANGIALQIGELGYLSNDYILYREPQQRDRWNAKFDSVANDVARLSVNQPEQQAIVANLASNLKNTKSVFDDIASSAVQPGGTGTAFVQLSWSRMAVQNQGMIFDADRLSGLIGSQVDDLRQTRTNLIFILMAAFVALLLSSYFFFYRRTLRSIDRLQQGAATIGKGDLEYVIPEEGDDEIAGLAISFNQMTQDLRRVVASKRDLEREIDQRKQAEASLALNNEELVAVNEELTITQEELQHNVDELTRTDHLLRETSDRMSSIYASMNEGLAIHDIVYSDGKAVDYIIRDINPAFEAITGINRKTAVDRSARELYGTGSPPYIDVYERVASGAGPEHFETYFPPLDKHFSISVFSPERGKFATVFTDITDRKRTETELNRLAEQRELALDAAGMGWWNYDPVTKIARYDERYRAIFHVTGDEMANEEILATRIYPEDLPGVLAKVDAALDLVNPQPYNAEYRIIWPDGTIRWIDAHGLASFEGEGKNRHATSLVGTVVDITERRNAEVALKKAHDDLRDTTQYLDNLINYANAPIGVWDPEFRITRLNRAFEKLTGLSSADAIGQPLELLFPEHFREEAMKIVRRTMRGERLETVELPVRDSAGGVRIVLWNSATLYKPDGVTVESTIAQGQDITLRKIAEAENVRAREEWERTFNTVPDLIALLDRDHRIQRVNYAMAERLGTTPEKAIGMYCHEVVHGTSVPPDFCPHALTCRDGLQHVAEVNEQSLGGTFIVSTTPLYDPEGNLTGSVHVARDITARKRAEADLLQKNEELTVLNEELTETQKELEKNMDNLQKSENALKENEKDLKEALAEKEILLDEIHHRVKNNLTAFISLLSLEGSYEESPAGLALKKDLQNRARSMALIHETLYRTKRYANVDMDVYLNTLIDQIADSYVTRKDVQVIVDAKNMILDLSRATPCGLIINELITNSFKYAFPESFDCGAVRHEPCTIRVSLTKDGVNYLLRVTDNGVGLPPGLDLKTTKSLGLKLVNFLAKHQLRATIEVKSEKGSEVLFRFVEAPK